MAIWCRYIFLLSVATMISCTPKQSLQKPIQPGDRVLIFVPGFKGTELLDQESNKKVWVTARNALFGGPSLALSSSEFAIETAPELKPDQVLSSIPIVAWLYSYDAYGSWLKFLSENFDQIGHVITFPYDWRQDHMQSVRDLSALVDSLKAQGAGNLSIVAHSMGGQIASYYLRYGTQQPSSAVENWAGAKNVSRVLFAGVPFRGSLTVFENMQSGIVSGLDSHMLNAEAVSSFGSSHYLLPTLSGEGIFTENREPLIDTLFAPDKWREYHWGLLKNIEGISSEVLDRRYAHHANLLARVKAYYSKLHAQPEIVAPSGFEVLNLVGAGTPTQSRAVFKDGRLLFSQADLAAYAPTVSKDFIYTDGDSVVSAWSQQLPPAFAHLSNAKSLTLVSSHGAYLTQQQIRKEILEFCFQK